VTKTLGKLEETRIPICRFIVSLNRKRFGKSDTRRCEQFCVSELIQLMAVPKVNYEGKSEKYLPYLRKKYNVTTVYPCAATEKRHW
jgi:hypothetical protein